MSMTSKDKLADALAETGDPALAEMAARARDGYYSDFDSPLALPIMQLVKDLRAAGHHALAGRAADGEFDATAEESRAWAESPEGQEAFRMLINRD
jgi:hypothetical protein